MPDMNRRYKPGEIPASDEFSKSAHLAGTNPYTGNVKPPVQKQSAEFTDYYDGEYSEPFLEHKYGPLFMRWGTRLLIGAIAAGATLVLYDSATEKRQNTYEQLAATCTGKQELAIASGESAATIVSEAQQLIEQQTGIAPSQYQLRAAIYGLNDPNMWVQGVELSFRAKDGIEYITIPTACEPLAN